jgi:hypothetical protein
MGVLVPTAALTGPALLLAFTLARRRVVRCRQPAAWIAAG